VRVRLLVVRHGATLNNASGRYTGQSDAGLSPLGVRQAEAVARRLAAEQLDRLVTSDLRRARDTAERIVRHHAIALEEDPDLREISMGTWEGLTYAEALERAPERVARWSADPCSEAPPGGETFTTLRDRVVRALDRWIAQCPSGTVLWVTHGGVLGVLLCHALGLDLSRRVQFRRDNAAITELAVADSTRVLVRHNDTAHLEHLAAADLTEPSQVL